MTGVWSLPGVLGVMVALVVAAVLLWPGRSRPFATPTDGPPTVGGSSGGSPNLRDSVASTQSSAPGARVPPGGALGRYRGRRPTRAVAAAEDRLADLLGLVAAPLRAGVPATTSLAAGAAAVEDDPLLGPLVEELVASGASGAPVSAVWLANAHQLDSDALRFVGQAWALSERTGAPLADALRSSEEVLRARMRSRQRLASAAAGPRASMGVLALLPLTGPVVGMACGVGPRQLYFSTTWSTASLVAGIGFAGLGWWWSRSILARAS